MAALAHKIDDALEKYYIAMGRTDYKNEDGTGKFYRWAEENELGDEDIEEDLNADYDYPDDSIFYDLHEEMNFPLSDDIKDDSDRIKAIRDIVRNIVNGQAAIFMPNQPIELYISQQTLQEIGDIIYKKQLSSLHGIDDREFIYWLVIGYVNNIPLLTWLFDAYTMEATKNFLKDQRITTVKGWAVDHKFMKNVWNKNKNLRDSLLSAMGSYGARVLPRFYYNSRFKIDDDIEEIVDYVSAVPDFLSHVMNNDQMNTPFSVDICFAVRGVQKNKTSCRLYDDSDDDDDDNDYDDDDDYDDYSWKTDLIGDLKQRMSANQR
eukprot:895990_1